MTFEEIFLDTLCHDLFDRLHTLPPPPEGYIYAYAFPVVTRNGDCWEVTSELCLRDRSGRMIRIWDRSGS